MSRVRIEFVGHIRTCAGERNTVIELPEENMSLASTLREVEKAYRNLRLFEKGDLYDGVLVFRRNEAGGLERIAHLEAPAVGRGRFEEEYVIATGMEGG